MQMMSHRLSVPTRGKGLYEITGEIAAWVRSTHLRQGLLTVLLRLVFVLGPVFVRVHYFLSSNALMIWAHSSPICRIGMSIFSSGKVSASMRRSGSRLSSTVTL